MLHDTHAHLDILLQKLGELSDKQTKIDRNRVDNLLIQHEFVIQPTTNSANFEYVYRLLKGFEKVFFLIGSHPEIVKQDFDLASYLESQREVIVELETETEMSQKVVGLGEVGLDYHYTQEPEIIKNQIALFEEQIALGIKLKLPLVIHCREAFKDLFSIIKEYPEMHGHFLVHCFTDDTDALKQVLRFGGKVAFGGVSTFKSANELQDAIKFCPNDSFMLETDLPFLAPTPYRGKTCTPDMISLIAKKVSEIKQQPESEVWESSLTNSRDLFGVFF